MSTNIDNIRKIKMVSFPLLPIGRLIRKIQMPKHPVRTVSGSELLSRTTAKVHYFMILMRLRSYLVNPTKV